ncbi:MAG: type I restriction-modification system specificity subunit [Candidatus Methanoperedens nitroreducens]|uniref:Type I restriction-modification system specificity subunit n=1 Tax=Candidatus Methanoperedens nitratireducens TaxID=1392998 RepID=A0A0P7ZJL1_9EURY|nr:MAG: type I restriction-modification system specificity subunit [Candidatus Methanoperedens sp. BLZ1]
MNAINGWKKTTLGQVATLVKGISYASEDYCGPGEGAVFITIKCVSKAGGFKREGIKYFKGIIAASQVLQPGELLIANTDLTRAGDIVGCPMLVPTINHGTITMSMDLSKVVLDDEKVDRDFLYYKLMTDSVRRFMKDHASGSTVLHLQTQAVPGLEIEIPLSKSEQTKIAEILSKVDRMIEQTEALIAKQRRIKTGLMQDLLTRGIDEYGNLRSEQTHKFKDSLLGRIPVEWEVKTLREVARGGAQNGFFKKPELVGSGYKLINVSEIYQPFSIDTNREEVERVEATPNDLSKYGVNEGDLFFTRSSLVLEGIAHCNVIRKINEPTLFECHVIRIRPDKEIVAPEFLALFCQSNVARLFLMSRAKHVTMTTISQPELEALNVLVPPTLEEQMTIVDSVLSSERIIRHTENQKNKLRLIKTALMQDLPTGKKRVTALLHDTEVVHG